MTKTIIGFRAMHFIVKDLELSVAHYEKWGFVVYYTKTSDVSLSVCMTLDDFGEFTILLTQFLDGRQVAVASWIEVVPDVYNGHTFEAIIDELEQQNVPLTQTLDVLKVIDGERVRITMDPDGNRLKLICRERQLN